MVIEYIRYTVPAARTEEFENAYQAAISAGRVRALPRLRPLPRRGRARQLHPADRVGLARGPRARLSLEPRVRALLQGCEAVPRSDRGDEALPAHQDREPQSAGMTHTPSARRVRQKLGTGLGDAGGAAAVAASAESLREARAAWPGRVPAAGVSAPKQQERAASAAAVRTWCEHKPDHKRPHAGYVPPSDP
jgi:hypothetical protein